MRVRAPSQPIAIASAYCLPSLSGDSASGPAEIAIEDLNASLVLDFLEYLEKQRHNSIRSRNARFAAIRSFMHYAGLQEPAALAITQSVLAIPMKRFERRLVGFLSREHIEAIIAAPDSNTSSGRRDRVMLATLYNTGARVSELIGMRIGDLMLESSAAVRIRGKGRKERSVPLWPATAAQLRRWLREQPRAPEAPLFPNRSGGQLTRTSVTERLALAVGPPPDSIRNSPHDESHRISSGTPSPCICCRPASTSPSSLSGSDTKAPQPLTCMSKQISP